MIDQRPARRLMEWVGDFIHTCDCMKTVFECGRMRCSSCSGYSVRDSRRIHCLEFGQCWATKQHCKEFANGVSCHYDA